MKKSITPILRVNQLVLSVFVSHTTKKSTGVFLSPLCSCLLESLTVVANFITNIRVQSHFAISVVLLVTRKKHPNLKHLIYSIQDSGQITYGLPVGCNSLVTEFTFILVNQGMINLCYKSHLYVN